MTITPTSTAPVLPAGATDGAGPTEPTAAGDFLNLVQQALTDTLDTATDEVSVPDTAAATLGLTGLVAPLSPVPVATTPAGAASAPAPTGAVGEAGVVVPGTTVGQAPGSAAEVAVAAPPAAASGTTTAELAGRAAAAATRPGEPAVPTGAAGSEPSGDDADSHSDGRPATRAPVAAPAPPSTGSPTATVVAAASDQAGAPQGVVAAVAPSVVATSAPAPAAADPHHVTGQVFPEVTSLVSRGEGTHRITLTLNPEALGEVRVVMTVRDGAVHVRLAAGHDARQVLVDGSPELTRLLELAGASESRIVVRDLPATAPASSTATGTPDRGSQQGTDLGTGADRSSDQHAGTRAHHPATDGTNDGTTRTFRGADGATQPRSNEPVTVARTAGVDVTM